MDELILVTGAAGFIGSNVARMLAEDGARVVACDWFERGGQVDQPAGRAAPRRHPARGPGAVAAGAAEPVSAIVHMGAVSATTETDVDLIVERNIRATLDLWAYAAERAGALRLRLLRRHLRRRLARVRGRRQPRGAGPKLRPLNAYGWSKHVVDRRIVDDVRRGRPTPAGWAGLKFFNVYGPGEAHKAGMRSVAHQIYPDAPPGRRRSACSSPTTPTTPTAGSCATSSTWPTAAR